jgi:hypothetical protein
MRREMVKFLTTTPMDGSGVERSLVLGLKDWDRSRSDAAILACDGLFEA